MPRWPGASHPRFVRLPCSAFPDIDGEPGGDFRVSRVEHRKEIEARTHEHARHNAPARRKRARSVGARSTEVRPARRRHSDWAPRASSLHTTLTCTDHRRSSESIDTGSYLSEQPRRGSARGPIVSSSSYARFHLPQRLAADGRALGIMGSQDGRWGSNLPWACFLAFLIEIDGAALRDL